MSFVRQAWYVIGFPHEFGDKPVARTILNQPMAIYRDSEDRLCAVEDRCPHRFVPLSLGWCEGANIRCAYHGLAFDGHDGSCTDAPMDGEALRNPRLKIKPYRIEERDALVWAWMGDAEAADPALIPAFPLHEDPDYRFVTGYLKLQGNQQLIADNLLDLSHVQFLHPEVRTEGDVRGFRHKVEQTGDTIWSRLDRPRVAPNHFQRRMWGSESELSDSYADCRWDVPGVIEVRTGNTEIGMEKGTGVQLPSSHLLTPETDFSTHYFWTSGRNRLLDDKDLDKQIGEAVQWVFTTQDGPMCEAQQRQMGDTIDFLSHNPVILKPDGAGVRARRVLQKRLREEMAAAETQAAE